MAYLTAKYPCAVVPVLHLAKPDTKVENESRILPEGSKRVVLMGPNLGYSASMNEWIQHRRR